MNLLVQDLFKKLGYSGNLFPGLGDQSEIDVNLLSSSAFTKDRTVDPHMTILPKHDEKDGLMAISVRTYLSSILAELMDKYFRFRLWVTMSIRIKKVWPTVYAKSNGLFPPAHKVEVPSEELVMMTPR